MLVRCVGSKVVAYHTNHPIKKDVFAKLLSTLHFKTLMKNASHCKVRYKNGCVILYESIKCGTGKRKKFF